ncbi:MAG TPA: ABC transporter permease [Candidatus Kapabacteria bacterium]|nr:ABC transporter permease [Candidatus Kapabacteria bacterium]
MKKYLAKRLLLLAFLLFAVSTLIFFFLHFIPGDPAVGILGEGADAANAARIRSELNLDKPLGAQFRIYNKNLLNLSFGKSIYNNKPVSQNIFIHLPNTLYLAAAAMTLALLVSFPLGALAAFKENSFLDMVVTFASSAGLAMPTFFLGPLLIILFSVKMGLLPVSGSEGFKSIILPVFTLGVSMCAFLTRIIKVSVGVELKKPYVLLARAKGLNETGVFFKHVLKNAMIPIITTVGMQLGALLTGAIVTETIFSWPGIGTLLINSINRRDYPMIQGLIVFITSIYLIVNFLVDLTYFFFDPRTRHEMNGN